MGYSTLNLSRAVKEGDTLMSPLILWNTGGAFVISALGLGIMDGNLQNLVYIPLAFACWLAPVYGQLLNSAKNRHDLQLSMLLRRRVIETSSALGDHQNVSLRPHIPARCPMTGAVTGRRSQRHRHDFWRRS